MIVSSFLRELQKHICTVGEAAAILQIRRGSVHALICRGTLASLKLGEIHILHKGSVLQYALSPQRSSKKRKQSQSFLENYGTYTTNSSNCS